MQVFFKKTFLVFLFDLLYNMIDVLYIMDFYRFLSYGGDFLYTVINRIGEYSANLTGVVCYLLGLSLGAVVFFLLVVPIHNVIKYRVVLLCGDTGMSNSRFNTRSPIVNFSAIGFISVLALGMGFGRPVYFDMHNFRRPGIHTCVVSLSGLVVYFVEYVVCFVFYTVLKALSIFSITDYHVLPAEGEWYVYAYYVFFAIIAFLRMYCLFSFLFNMIPFGPTDMADVLYMFLPVNWSDGLRNNPSFTGFLLVLLAFLSVGKPSGLIPDVATRINNIINLLVDKIF